MIHPQNVGDLSIRWWLLIRTVLIRGDWLCPPEDWRVFGYPNSHFFLSSLLDFPAPHPCPALSHQPLCLFTFTFSFPTPYHMNLLSTCELYSGHHRVPCSKHRSHPGSLADLCLPCPFSVLAQPLEHCCLQLQTPVISYYFITLGNE